MDWGSANFVILVAFLCAGLGYVLCWLNSKNNLIEMKALIEKKSAEDIKLALLEYKSSQELIALFDLRFRDGHQAGSAEAISNYKNSEGYDALFSLEHTKGKNAGMNEERTKWQLTYTPIVINNESFFSHTIETGYEMQIFYAGFPINDPLRRITDFHKKSKDHNINKFIEIAEKAVEVAVAIASKNKIPVSIKKTRQEKKIEK